MTASTLIFFIVLAVVLVLLLSWIVRPPKRSPLAPDEVLAALSEERHYARLPQILQCLRKDDTAFMLTRGHATELARIRQERKRIALRYLDYLKEEFRILLECSRILATMAPELRTRREIDRAVEHFRFLWTCRVLRWRLRLGLPPWETFGTLSDMAGTLTLQLESATARLGERAALAKDSSLLRDDRRD